MTPNENELRPMTPRTTYERDLECFLEVAKARESELEQALVLAREVVEAARNLNQLTNLDPYFDSEKVAQANMEMGMALYTYDATLKRGKG